MNSDTKKSNSVLGWRQYLGLNVQKTNAISGSWVKKQ